MIQYSIFRQYSLISNDSLVRTLNVSLLIFSSLMIITNPFSVFAQQGGSATSGPATGGDATGPGAVGGSATSGPATGGDATSGNSTSNSSSLPQELPF